MQMIELSLVLLVAFSIMYLISYMPVNFMVKRQSNNIMLTYYLSMGARAVLVVGFMVLGATVELLFGIAFGIGFEIIKMFRMVRTFEAREVLA
jgi:hypothetical protein